MLAREYLISHKSYIVKWLVFWGVGMGGYLSILNPLGISHLENTHITIPYFLGMAALGAKLFNLSSLLLQLRYWKNQLGLIFLTCLGYFLSAYLLNRYIPISEEVYHQLMDIKIYFPLFLLKTSATKVADIVFQQTLILAIILYLQEEIRSYKDVIVIFTIVFSVLHFPLIFVFKFMAFIFIIPSIFAGVIFSYLITTRKNGISLAFFTHVFFYLVTGVFLRVGLSSMSISF